MTADSCFLSALLKFEYLKGGPFGEQDLHQTYNQTFYIYSDQEEDDGLIIQVTVLLLGHRKGANRAQEQRRRCAHTSHRKVETIKDLNVERKPYSRRVSSQRLR